MELGKRLTDLRVAHGWSRSHVAKLIGTNSRSVENWENSVSTPSLENIAKLSRIFHTTPNALMGFSPHSTLVLDDLPLDDQYTLRRLYSILQEKMQKIIKFDPAYAGFSLLT